jgi:short-subunit dehydrogenase
MMKRKTCIVIGVGPGLGLSLVRKFATQGFAVAMISRNPEKLTNYKKDFDKEGLSTYTFPADIGIKKELVKTIKTIIEKFKRIDTIIFNASVLTEGSPSEIKVKMIKGDLNINLFSAIHTVQTILPAMKEQGFGTILFTGSGAAVQPISPIISLSMSKSALRFYALGLAEELKKSDVYVGTVTIKGAIEKNTHFDPEKIAETFWWLYQNHPETIEFVYE